MVVCRPEIADAAVEHDLQLGKLQGKSMHDVVSERRDRAIGVGREPVQQALSRVDDDVVDAGVFYGPNEGRQLLVPERNDACAMRCRTINEKTDE